MATSILGLVGGTLVIYIVACLVRRAKLPPGPCGLPLLGNLHQAPKGAPWLTFTKWIKQYGNIVSVNLGGTIIIVGDYGTAKGLLDKRRNIYSSRPRLVMGHELVCNSNPIVFKPLGNDFLTSEASSARVEPTGNGLLHTYPRLGDSATTQEPSGVIRKHRALRRSVCNELGLLNGFRDAYPHRKGVAGGTNSRMHEELPRCRPTGSLDRGCAAVAHYLPAAIAPWKRQAAKWFHELDDLHVQSYNEAIGREGWNWAKDFERAIEAQIMTEQQVPWDVGILADAEVETMSAILMIFVLACVAHPEWLAKAQMELDKVVGSERLPEFGNLKDLPYIHAVVEEVFRWRHPQQAGIPHATTHKDYYHGYLIPKGSVVIPLFSAMRHNEDLLDKPAEFRPERWMGKSQSQFNNFGYGRRICPGRHIARNSASIVVARLLWAFNVRTPSGKKLVVEESMFTTGFVSAAKPFVCIFEPRSETPVRVIQKSFEKVDKNLDSS